MTIAQLEYLIAVANYGSFSTAAEKCFVTQPSLSIQIKNLEDELGVILLDRSRKPIIPTETGGLIIKQAQETIYSFTKIKDCVDSIKGTIAGELRVAFIPTVAPYWVHRLVPVILKKYPLVRLHINEMITSNIIEALHKDQIDIGILAEGFVPSDIQEEQIAKDTFFAFISPQHPLYEKEEIELSDLESHKIILLTEGHCFRDQVMSLCSRSKTDNQSLTIECGSIETLIRITLSTKGITIIPQMALPYIGEKLQTCIRPVKNQEAHRIITLAKGKHSVKNGLIHALKTELIEIATTPP